MKKWEWVTVNVSSARFAACSRPEPVKQTTLGSSTSLAWASSGIRSSEVRSRHSSLSAQPTICVRLDWAGNRAQVYGWPGNELTVLVTGASYAKLRAGESYMGNVLVGPVADLKSYSIFEKTILDAAVIAPTDVWTHLQTVQGEAWERHEETLEAFFWREMKERCRLTTERLSVLVDGTPSVSELHSALVDDGHLRDFSDWVVPRLADIVTELTSTEMFKRSDMVWRRASGE